MNSQQFWCSGRYTWNIIKFKRNCCKKQNTRHWIRTVKSARAKCYNGRFNSVTFKFRDCKSNIATISTSNILEIEFKFEYGTGYRLAANIFRRSWQLFAAWHDFHASSKVDFKIENVYDAANNITERLFIDIWTNGSISPNDSSWIT
jgi:DNA-directed RNA polymerase alpha subunit